ncbi:uncharacterized protein LOC122154669 [Tyto alba]|uniref:uncharacterized protein LOC122154402 n=1 Tax=Tyto alba TaxID=56313 RepID=UPI001C67DE57|nr:uncharacterized protein LOC122154402 [Tyto alba]XP_042660952.1 uncharacterized protein LOC122154669 [Tyto alba]
MIARKLSRAAWCGRIPAAAESEAVKKPLLDSKDTLRFQTRQVDTHANVRFVKTTPRPYPALLRPAKIQVLPKVALGKAGRRTGGQAAGRQEPPGAPQPRSPPRRAVPCLPRPRDGFNEVWKSFPIPPGEYFPIPIQSKLPQGIRKSNELFHLTSPRRLEDTPLDTLTTPLTTSDFCPSSYTGRNTEPYHQPCERLYLQGLNYVAGTAPDENINKMR